MHSDGVIEGCFINTIHCRPPPINLVRVEMTPIEVVVVSPPIDRPSFGNQRCVVARFQWVWLSYIEQQASSYSTRITISPTSVSLRESGAWK